MLFVCHPKSLHTHCFQFLLGPFKLPKETKDNAYAKCWGDKQRALWNVMVFSGVVSCLQLFREMLSEKCARDNPERYCGWFRVHCFSKKFERMAGEAMDICLWVLKESNKSRFDSYSVRNSVLIISHITFQDCRVHIFSDNLSRNSCIYFKRKYQGHLTTVSSQMNW